MNGIQQFLEVYRKKLFAAEDERKVILDVIFQVSGVMLSESEITLKNGVLTVQSDSSTRNHLFLYRIKILEAINQKREKPIREIR